MLKMARIVTGSVAESVAPTEIASTNEMAKPLRGISVQRYKTRPNTRAEINVPANAKVRIVPIFPKKLAYSLGVSEIRSPHAATAPPSGRMGFFGLFLCHLRTDLM
jgi:hypothetical protein